MDVVNPNLIIKWHEFNDRPLSVKAVKDLKENFVDNGQQVTSPANVFRLLVKNSWLDFVPEKTIVGKGIDELKQFRVKQDDDGPVIDRIVACGGNHCREATKVFKQYWNERETEALELKLIAYPDAEDLEAERLIGVASAIQTEWKTRHAELLNIRERRKHVRMWGMELFDIGE